MKAARFFGKHGIRVQDVLPPGATLPQILGHEFSGRVVAVCEGVERLRPGQPVSIQPQIGPRYDYFGRRNLSYLGPMASIVGLSWAWGMGGLALVNDAIPMPDELTDEQEALVEPAGVPVHAVASKLKILVSVERARHRSKLSGRNIDAKRGSTSS